MLLIRVDDFLFVKHSEAVWKHSEENFAKFDNVMHAHAREYCLGIVPKNTSDGNLRFVRELTHVTPAMHGIGHDIRFQNEFRDHETEDGISLKLIETKHNMEVVLKKTIDTYIPPCNVIDTRTARALVHAGFKKLLVGPGADSAVCDVARGLGLDVSYSEEPLEYGRSDELVERGAPAHLREEAKKRDLYLTLHWTWEWNIGLQHLDKFLSEVDDVR